MLGAKVDIFDSIRINGLEVKNRIVMPPMGTNFANVDHSASQKHFNYIEARARGGVGLIMMEYACVEEGGLAAPFQLGIFSDSHIAGLNRLAEIAHRHNAKIGMQLHHGGIQAKSSPRTPVGPSEINGAKELTKDEISAIVKAFAAGAERVKKAGMDLVELHGAHGYLIGQFMSPYYNKRTDEYGGDIEGYLRFPIEVYRAVREVVGEKFPITIRISGDEHVDDGCSIEDKILMVKKLVEEGIDGVHVAGGLLETIPWVVAPGAIESGYNIKVTERIKAAVNVPIIAVGKLHEPDYAKSIIADGKADMVALGRALIVDPEYPNKVASGHESDIRRCLYCIQHCLDIPAGCVQNPDFGFEGEHEYNLVRNPKKVLVVGGGVAGLEAAVTLAKRGHGVVLCEKDKTLGGMLNIACIPPHKQMLKESIEYRIRELKRLNVEVRLNSEVDLDLLKEINPQSVIIATGSKPFIPKIEGVRSENVTLAKEVLKGEVNVSGNVLIIGGGSVGIETAEFIYDDCDNVIVVEMIDNIAGDMAFIPRTVLMERIEGKINLITNATVKNISSDCVIIEKNEEIQRFEEIDKIIIATGYKPDDELSVKIKEAFPNIDLHVVGDSQKVRSILEAIGEGNRAGRLV
ncbi:MAG: FAD-dependent oxidoreductase [Filifactoraceae bacterium]